MGAYESARAAFQASLQSDAKLTEGGACSSAGGGGAGGGVWHRRWYEAVAQSPRLETDSVKRKGIPVFSGVIRYFPDALAEVARLSLAGNEKHNPGQPLHWSRGKSTDHLDCIARHMHEAGTIDSDGILHDAKIAWRALANLQVLLERVRGLPISPGSRE